MTARVDETWSRPEDRAWADRLRLRLVVAHDVSPEVADDVLAEAAQACAESGEAAVELFGAADAYAREVVEQRVPVAVRAEADLDGSVRRDQWRMLAYGTGGPGIVLCVLVGLREGWGVGTSPGGLVLLVAVIAALGASAWGLLERHAGELGRGWAAWALAGAVVVAGAWVGVTFRDESPLGTVSVLAPLAVCVGLVVVASRLPERRVPAPDWAALPADAWFDRLAALLRGRYYLSRADVAAQVEDARAYWQESGTRHPHDEFGDPSVYALRLVQGSRRPHRGRRRTVAGVRTGVAVIWLGLVVVTIVEGGSAGDLAWRVGGFVLFAAIAWHGWREQDGPAV